MLKVVVKGWLTGLIALLCSASLVAGAADYRYVGSAASRKYHYPGCVWAQKIEPGAAVMFRSAKEARQKGFGPCLACRPPSRDQDEDNLSGGLASCSLQGRWVRVIDGQTMVVQLGSRHETVRLLGVYAFEASHPLRRFERPGKEALGFARQLAEGKPVRLEFDGRPWDGCGRLLAYVYLPEGTLLNAEIIRQGYGFASSRYPFRYLEEFRRLEKEARKGRRGLWGGRVD